MSFSSDSPRSEPRIDRARAARIVQESLSQIRHDVRNRLGAIRNAMFYIRRRIEKTELWETDLRLARFVDLINEELERADEMLGMHSGLAGLYTAEPQAVDLSDAVAVAASDGLTNDVRVDIAVDPFTLQADFAELVTALRCMIRNAAEASPVGGVVEIRGTDSERSYRLSISDQGPGFGDVSLADARRAFFTTKPEHGGLGLAIAWRVLRQCDATFVIDDAAPGGCVVVTFEKRKNSGVVIE